MKGMLLLVAMAMTTTAGAVIVRTESATGDAQTPSRFELAHADGPRGLGVEGCIHNGLAWRITNVRLLVDSVDASGAVTASALGWALGYVKVGGRGYFYVPVSSAANTYRATVQSFDKAAIEAPGFDAP